MYTANSFKKFDVKNTRIKAVAIPSTANTMVNNANELDMKFLNKLISTKNEMIDASCSVDSSSRLIVEKIKCNYPTDPSKRPSSIIAYKCTNNKPDNLMTVSNNDSGQSFNTLYIPRGGWTSYNVNEGKAPELYAALKDNPTASNLVTPIIQRNTINVTDKDGQPLYLFNSNSTPDKTTWTKLEDLCIKG